MSGNDAAGCLSSARTLLVICPSWVGDVVMSTPVLRAVREILPTSRIVALCRPGLDALLNGTPWIDAFVIAGRGGLLGPLRTATLIRRHSPDAALLLPNSFRSALTARLAGARIRAGYGRDGRTWLLTHALRSRPRERPFPAIDAYAALGEWALGVEHIDRRMELAVAAPERDAAEHLLAGVDRPFALLCPGASKPQKRWPVERFALVADELANQRGLAIVAGGSPGEADLVAALQQAAKTPVLNLAQRGLTLGSLKAIVQRCSITITNDTGPRHIAAALGRPVVSLCGPTDHRWTTLNYPHEHVLTAEPFLPEQLVADHHPRACAIERIAVGDVVFAAARLLDAAPAAAMQGHP